MKQREEITSQATPTASMLKQPHRQPNAAQGVSHEMQRRLCQQPQSSARHAEPALLGRCEDSMESDRVLVFEPLQVIASVRKPTPKRASVAGGRLHDQRKVDMSDASHRAAESCERAVEHDGED